MISGIGNKRVKDQIYFEGLIENGSKESGINFRMRKKEEILNWFLC